MQFISSFIIAIFLIFNSPESVDENKYTAYIFLHESCLISQFYSIHLRDLEEKFDKDNIHFVGVFPNSSTSLEAIDEFKVTYKLNFEMIKDEDQSLTKKLGAQVTPEVVVVNDSDGEKVYQGRIDDSYFRVGKRRTVKTTNELQDVFQSLQNKEKVSTEWKEAIGCFIQFN